MKFMLFILFLSAVLLLTAGPLYAGEILICDVDAPGGKAFDVKVRFFSGLEINKITGGRYLDEDASYGLFNFDGKFFLAEIVTKPPYKSKSSCVARYYDDKGKPRHWRVFIR